LADGLRDEAALVGASVVGGDVSGGDLLTVTVSGIGELRGRPAVLRSGAEPGDQVAVAGRLGWAAAGLAVLSRGFGTPRALVEAYRRPDVDYSAGLRAASSGVHAMCDASDVSIDVETDRLDVAEPIASVAAAYGADPLTWVLGGGQDHALVATFAPKKRLPKGFVRIGQVNDVGDGGPSVTVDGAAWAGSTGHTHFS
jgi:thiamine-monophosphate kinase